jgi:uncharacterized membrane protein YgdD (TMEM256/DUF423 family)
MWIVVAGLLGATGVAIGAYVAHGLEDHLQRHGVPPGDVARRLLTAETGVRYHLIHAVALLGLGCLSLDGSSRALLGAGWAFLVGTLLFSGSLYTIVITGISRFGAIAPIGGLSLIIGWICVAIAGWPRRS